jgi:lipoprotein NlpI
MRSTTHLHSAWILILVLLCYQSAAKDDSKDVRKATGEDEYAAAVKRASERIAADSTDEAAYRMRAVALIALGKSREAIADLDHLLMVNPRQPNVLELRGTEKLKLRHFVGAIDDFDQECRLDPRREPWHWKRGLAYYYAGQYAKGRDQFQRYHDGDDNDVENAVWRVLCMARLEQVGLAKAQQDILVVRRDSRVPMMEVYSLFSGKGKPDDILQAIENGTPGKQEKNSRIFYGHLYLGLYFDMTGQSKAAEEHLKTAVEHPIEHFMWDIAKLHLAILTTPGKPAGQGK